VRYILGILGVIAVFILLIILILSLRPNDPSSTRTDTPVPKLADVADSETAIRYVNDGPINAEENHRQVRIVIDKNKRAIDILTGYQGTVLATQTFDNNKEAFTEFLAALDRAGFTIKRNSKLDSEAGICPAGNRYVFELYNSPNNSSFKPFRRWQTSCGLQGNFGGTVTTIRSLFKAQIPNYEEFIRQTPGLSTFSY
jgi:hypothetical protein